MAKQQPSEQDIQDYLKGLNRLHQSWSGSTESAVAKQRGMSNYSRWFKDHNITIVEDPHSHELKALKWTQKRPLRRDTQNQCHEE